MNSSYNSAFDAACRKLSARMKTEHEMRSYILSLGFDEAVTEQVICELKSYGYLDDEKYCRAYFRYAKAKNKADGRIVRELCEKGISGEMARNAIEDMRAEFALTPDGCDEGVCDDRMLAQKLGEKMMRQQLAGGKEVDEKFLARVGRRLAGLGYDSATIYAVMGKLKQDERNRQRECEDVQ